jgi:hypothetical protein
MKGNNWPSLLLSALIGVVLSGGAMVVRGEMLGNAAADKAEERLNIKVDDLKEEIGQDIREIKDAIIRLEGKLDK